MREFVRWLPHTETVLGMRDVMLRGWGAEQSISVWYGLGITSAWIVVFLVLSWIFVNRKLG